ncbi:MAG: deaminase domain-containing protein [Crocosphaera sp.]
MLNNHNRVKESLGNDVVLLRDIYLKKPFPKGNVSVIEVYLKNGVSFCIGATSRAKSPVSIPKPKSQGGQFEPIIDSFSQRIMDTDAEYKALSAIADTLDSFDTFLREGVLYLYTERKPCESCQEIIQQFQAKYPKISIEVFWDYPYP